VLQVPPDKYIVNLGTPKLINYAHKNNIAVQYWTINDEDDMRRLIEMGCDCIMTDNPELLRSIIDEYK
ncbi:MAG: glycerophosphodiester phosphodiesterase, partial [Clostridia bacterium]|nr:glycerophosphodiester phosphodiesterase [Clostridia bacterium]